MYMSPAEYVIYAFNGQTNAAKAIGISRSAVHHWTTRYRGRVPSSQLSTILSAAAMSGIDITAADLIQGRKVKKVHRAPKLYKIRQNG